MPSWFDFLRIEADLAMTFIDTARTRSNPAHSARALRNAGRAFAQIKHCLMKPVACGLSVDEIGFLKRRCAEIDLALVDFEPPPAIPL